MQLKILSKRAMLIAVLSTLVLFAALLLFFISKNSIQGSSASLVENVVELSNQEQASFGLPVRLRIPVIHVDTAIISVGLTSDGAMDVPKDPAEVAWFNLGLRAGENGTAVIAGHYGWKNNIPAVFDNLSKLDIGDKIFVEDKRGVTTIFVVREMRIYSKDEVVPDVFSSNDEKVHINLITCTGVWNNAEKTRSERLVVFTDKE